MHAPSFCSHSLWAGPTPSAMPIAECDPHSRLARPFVPPTITLKELHDAVPKHLLQKDPLRSTGYVLRDVFFCLLFFAFGTSIERLVSSSFGGLVPLSAPWQVSLARTTLWLIYWWWQGIAFASFFCIGKRCSLLHTKRRC